MPKFEDVNTDLYHAIELDNFRENRKYAPVGPAEIERRLNELFFEQEDLEKQLKEEKASDFVCILLVGR